MILLKKSALRQVGIAALIALVLGVVLVGVTLAAGSASIQTAPMQQDAKVYQDANGNGLNDPEEYVGTFDVYDGMKPITISWNAASFPAGANGSYRVSLWQNTTPLGTATWKEITFGHHWASNPNGTQFTVGPFGPGKVCVTCPSLFKVEPETYQLVNNAGTYEYIYTALPSALSLPAALEQSEEVILAVTDYTPSKEEGTKGGGVASCAYVSTGSQWVAGGDGIYIKSCTCGSTIQFLGEYANNCIAAGFSGGTWTPNGDCHCNP